MNKETQISESVLKLFFQSDFPFESYHHIYFKRDSPSSVVFGHRVYGKFIKGEASGHGGQINIELLKISYFNNFLSEEALEKLEESSVSLEDIDFDVTYKGIFASENVKQ